ncbi:hypothetical protein NIES4071_69290 [Calothrix sp. NIES-4071]|nr:hypothetical protein NIES4071_69290 [Calothrix sp. NIES-4071]BAZ61206.1 hypothetical protein NIES4105_69240 [Calothrix sp. NIES-4105]
MSQMDNELLEFQLLGIKPVHFADLVRAAQLMYNPASCMSGIDIEVDWEELGVPNDVLDNLRVLGYEYRYALPDVPPSIIWSKLSPETRVWFVANKEELWKFEEYFPALDED